MSHSQRGCYTGCGCDKRSAGHFSYQPPIFKKFPKIPRLNREIVITEKLDGVNAGVYVSEDGQHVTAASRNRWLVPGKNDNFGFATWVYENQEELRELGPGMHWGEWWGQGIQRRYGLDKKVFSLFNVGRWKGEGGIQIGTDTPPPCCSVVPILYVGPFNQHMIEEQLQDLRDTGSYAAPGFFEAEGIIIFHCASRSYFKVTLVNDEKPKGSNELG